MGPDFRRRGFWSHAPQRRHFLYGPMSAKSSSLPQAVRASTALRNGDGATFFAWVGPAQERVCEAPSASDAPNDAIVLPSRAVPDRATQSSLLVDFTTSVPLDRTAGEYRCSRLLGPAEQPADEEGGENWRSVPRAAAGNRDIKVASSPGAFPAAWVRIAHPCCDHRRPTHLCRINPNR
jgi:hypothetical protein